MGGLFEIARAAGVGGVLAAKCTLEPDLGVREVEGGALDGMGWFAAGPVGLGTGGMLWKLEGGGEPGGEDCVRSPDLVSKMRGEVHHPEGGRRGGASRMHGVRGEGRAGRGTALEVLSSVCRRTERGGTGMVAGGRLDGRGCDDSIQVLRGTGGGRRRGGSARHSDRRRAGRGAVAMRGEVAPGLAVQAVGGGPPDGVW